MFKKVVFLVITLVIVFSLSACGPSPQEEAPTPVPKLVEFLVTSLIITPPIVVTGSVATVKAEIRNLDDTEGLAEVTMNIDDGETNTKEIILDGSGTQTVSFDVTKTNGGKYDIEIGGVTKTLVVVELTNYLNSTYRYSISHPAGWTIDEQAYNRVAIHAPLALPMLIISFEVNDELKTLDAVQQDFIKESENSPSVVILSSEQVRYTDELSVYENIATVNINGAETKGKLLVLASGHLTFVSMFLAQENRWDDWQSVADTMLKSFNPPSPDFVPPSKPTTPPNPAPAPVPPSVVTKSWASDNGQGPIITEFPAVIEKVYVNYNYESQVGSIHKIIWYDHKGEALSSTEHEATRASGTGTWSLADSQLMSWPAGSYKAELFIDDSLLATVTWIVLD